MSGSAASQSRSIGTMQLARMRAGRAAEERSLEVRADDGRRCRAGSCCASAIRAQRRRVPIERRRHQRRAPRGDALVEQQVVESVPVVAAAPATSMSSMPLTCRSTNPGTSDRRQRLRPMR